MINRIYKIADYDRFKSEISFRYTATWGKKLEDFKEDSRFTVEEHDNDFITVHFVGTVKEQYIAAYFLRDYFVPVDEVNIDELKKAIDSLFEWEGFTRLNQCLPEGFGGLHSANNEIYINLLEHWVDTKEAVKALIDQYIIRNEASETA